MKATMPALLRVTLLFLFALRPASAWGVPSLAERCGSPQKSVAPAAVAKMSARAKAAEVDRLLRVATLSYDQKKWSDALDALDAASALIPSADILFNKAQTCREAGAERAALSLYEQTAQQATDATLKTAASKRAAELRRKLSRDDELAAINERKQNLARQQQLIAQQQSELAEQQRRLDEQRALIPTVASAPPPATEKARPPYKRWWFWTAIGGAVAAVVVVSAVTAYSLPRQPSYPYLQDVTLR